MDFKAAVGVSSPLGNGVWLVHATREDVGRLGPAKCGVGSRSVVGVPFVEVAPDGRNISFSVKQAHVLNLGDGNECLVISLARAGGDGTDEVPEGRLSEQPKGAGDANFLRSCRSEGLPDETVRLAEDFLAAVRDFSEDDLHEGLSRKWVTKPRNFLAITIQNRNKQFCVHVKKSTALHGLTGVLDIRDDRPGYARFWLQHRGQLDAAIKAAKHSFEA